MKHYFTNNQEITQEYQFSAMILETYFTFHTHNGVFSNQYVDKQTKILIDVVASEVVSPKKILDMCCGYGVIGIALQKYYNCEVTCSDINEQAIALCNINKDLNSVTLQALVSDGFSAVTDKFDVITINPPIHAGKQVCYKIYADAKSHLTADGAMFIVINKKHGALSTIAYLKQIGYNTTIIYKKKQIYVLKCC